LLEAGLDPVVVVASEDARFADVLAGLAVQVMGNPAPDLGISRSIGIGLEALPAGSPAALIAVADQPYLTAQALAELVRAFLPGRIVVPRYGTHRGNPPIFDRRFFPELLALEAIAAARAWSARIPRPCSRSTWPRAWARTSTGPRIGRARGATARD